MSEIERRRRYEADPYAPPLPTSWREAKEEDSYHYRAAIRIHNGGTLSRQIAHHAKELLAEAEDLGPAGNLIVQSFIYKSLETRDGYMDQ